MYTVVYTDFVISTNNKKDGVDTKLRPPLLDPTRRLHNVSGRLIAKRATTKDRLLVASIQSARYKADRHVLEVSHSYQQG